MSSSKRDFFDNIFFSIDFIKSLLQNSKNTENENIRKISDLQILKTNDVLYPGTHMSIPINDIGYKNFIGDLNNVDKTIGIVAYKNIKDKNDNFKGGFYKIGTTANVKQIIKIDDDNIQILLEGLTPFKILKVKDENEYSILADVKTIKYKSNDSIKIKGKTYEEYEATKRVIKELSLQLIELCPKIPNEIKILIKENNNITALIYFWVHAFNIDIKYKQKILEANSLIKKCEIIISKLQEEIRIEELQKDINKKIQEKQKEFYIKQQIDILKKEIGDYDNKNDYIDVLLENGKNKKWDKKTFSFFKSILKKANNTSQNNADYTVLISQAEFLLELPWNNYSESTIDLKECLEILNKSHYGLNEVKDIILEYLAVIHKVGRNVKGKIICLLGPPGVGKTSLCETIAKALKKEYVKISLGGIDDEAEIRGHRKTYVGSMAGRILKGLQSLKTSNPVFVLDEIDKMTKAHGDPISALLEVLDPNQNNKFVDHYLEIPYDLSKVFFIATANDLENIPQPLLDRLEIIELEGYAIEEKIEICKQYLIQKVKKDCGLSEESIVFSDDIINEIIDEYTYEAGIRSLERQIEKICRKICRKTIEGKKYNKNISYEDIKEYLGNKKYKRDLSEVIDKQGIAIGLGWTSFGGDVLFIESVLVSGNGGIHLSGNLKQVTQESATIAFIYLKSHYKEYNIDKDLFEKYDVQIHIPDGATPKDGPSAGITFFTALLSLFTNHKVKSNLAMTGEITLRGKILKVGGIKNKVLAAKRSGIKEIIMCKDNKNDVEEINKEYISDIKFTYIEDVKEIYNLAINN